jgi:molybdenum cofactor cytidylyltransferase
VLEQTIMNASASVDQCIVVLRAKDQQFADDLSQKANDPSLKFFLAPDSAAGMAHSLANIISQLPTCDGAMIFLGDMPYLEGVTIKKLLAAFEEQKEDAPIIVPTVLTEDEEGALASISGHPVIFSSVYFQELTQLTGDSGAKPIITAHKDRVVKISVEDLGVLKDVDRPSDILI